MSTTRTPPKRQAGTRNSTDMTEQTGAAASKVRTSIGEWETGRVSPQEHQGPSSRDALSATDSTKNKTTISTGRSTSVEIPATSPTKPNYGGNRIAEARACLNKAKTHLSSSRNTRTDIKEGVVAAVERLFQLVKEAEADRKEKGQSRAQTVEKTEEIQKAQPTPQTLIGQELLKKLEEHEALIKENNTKMEELKNRLCVHQSVVEGMTYASVVAGGSTARPPQQSSLHSVVVSSNDEDTSGEEVIEKIRKAVNAREGDITIDRIRKAKDKKVVIGCRDEAEIKKVAQKIRERGERLCVEEMKNKDPLVVLYNVLQINTDEDVVESIKKQNKNILKDLSEEERKFEIRFRRRARNPLTAHVVAKVSPKLWKRLTEAGAVQIDMQRVRVADQSPLIQCSRCLGYGHGRRFCHDAVEVCSHCGGQHLRTQCAEWLAGTPPNCVNCVKAKMLKVEHNAFSAECPVRRKWETLARSTLAYC